MRRRFHVFSWHLASLLLLLLLLFDVYPSNTQTPAPNQIDFTNTNKTKIIQTKDGRQIMLPFNVLSIFPRYPSQHNSYGLTIDSVRPVFDIATEDVVKREIMPKGWVNFTFFDDRLYEQASLTERWSTIALFRAYYEKRLDAIIGFADNYGLAAVSKISAGLDSGIPIITTIGMLVAEFGMKVDFPLLTRMRGTDKHLSATVYEIFGYHNISDEKPATQPPFQYTNIGFFLNSKRNARNLDLQPQKDEQETTRDGRSGKVSTDCYFGLSAIRSYFHASHPIYESWNKQITHVAFDETLEFKSRLHSWLKELSMSANVIILCASPDTVREIMLAANDLGMTSGQYVFINIDVSTGSHAARPWLRNNDTNSAENIKAKEAYKALKTISLRRSDLEEYKNFETRVKKRAEEKYNYSRITGKEYEMNNFISAFYDAVLLYAIALNETITDGLDPRNGQNITNKMWNRTFVGITGNVSIDANGDRYSDYSLLDFDPVQEKFVEVAYYSGATNELKKVSEFHWVNGRPPTDKKICGYDQSKCPKGYPLHVYLLVGAAGLILLLCALFFCFWRRYKLEQEIAAMSWKIPWDELQGDEGQKKDKHKKGKSKRKVHDGYLPESDPLLRSNSRCSTTSDKLDEDFMSPMRMRLAGEIHLQRSSSSGATRKISAIIDRKWSYFRKKSSPNGDKNGGIVGNHVDTLREVEDGECSPLNEVQFQLPLGDRRVSSPSANSEAKKKSSNEEDFDNAAKKSLSLRNRKLSFAGVSFKSGSQNSVETLALITQKYTKTVVYKGTMVAIKTLNIDLKKYPRLDLTKKQMTELKRMKDLQNEHITRFTGACLEYPHYCIVTEYCPKGSLEDILENEKIELDNMFKISLLHDLVKGMHFLHNSEIRSHGRLKSSNCVVDSRFVLKITDFGLHSIHAIEEKDNIEELGEHAYYRKKLWTSPELLRLGSVMPPSGSQKGDVYSFAIILHEMLFRKGVFNLEDDSISPKEIVDRLIKVPTSVEDDPFRPFVPEQSESDVERIDPTLIELMQFCWSEEASSRPDMTTIRKVVRSLNKDNETANLVDNLLKRMEQYANNLEGLVEERTQEYLAEKKKVEELLHQLLPPSVADQLISGRSVQAESYECVTIYFSDIVGFTALSSASTPMQVVTLLNDLYLAFDGVVDNFKVYKVETIGDAYMVVSGLPERHEEHASQIAQMSLALLHKVKTFVIRHRPQEQLKLRIGMHSGSVVAGVVGSKMPRYCLFGDTVNTSSRMESNGLPLRIHVSEVTKNILEKDAGFRLELRGQVEMKGKGIQTTYWLKGYREVEIPDFGPDFR